VLPTKRRKAKAELTAKIQSLRQKLVRSLTKQFRQELKSSVHRIRDAVAPYTRFVRAEQQRLEEIHSDLTTSRDTLVTLLGKLEQL